MQFEALETNALPQKRESHDNSLLAPSVALLRLLAAFKPT